MLPEIARLLGERKNLLSSFTKEKKDNIHISLIGQRIILVVIFDQRSSLGLVRLGVKKTSEVLTRLFDDITSKAEKEKWKAAKQQNRLCGDKR